MSEPLKAPFPWFGGKSRAAHLIWDRFGNCGNYVEPFAGSLAVLFRRPSAPGNEIVNDLDCYVANAWRAMKFAPYEVAVFCDWPVNEADLHARHRWLHGRVEFRERMENDPDYFDAKIAGFWIWGISCSIGNHFSRTRPQKAPPRLAGQSGSAGHVGGALDLQSQTYNLGAFFSALADRLRFVTVTCGGWERVLTKASTYGQGLTAVLLDPPYDDGDKHDDVYGKLSRCVSAGVREWAIANGENPLLRIALCGYEGEHALPEGWRCVAWKAAGGYASAAGNTENSSRERIWFSPHCLDPEGELFKCPPPTY